MYKYGEKEGKTTSGFSAGDIMVVLLDQDQGLLEFYNESQKTSCGRFDNVFGYLVFGVQMEGDGGSVDILQRF